jgi:hypothetical protein
MTDADSSKFAGLSGPKLFTHLQEALAEASARAVREALAAVAQEVEQAHLASLGALGKTNPDELEAGQYAEIGALAIAADYEGRVLGTSPLATDIKPNPCETAAVLQTVTQLEHDAAAFAHEVDVAPYSREARREFFRRARLALSASGAAATQLAVIDVVAAMFDYAIDHERMPEPAKPFVWRLQRPVITLALLDPGYLGDEPRSLRRLVEHLAAISVAFSDDLSRGSELHRRLETVVRAVETVAEALHTRSSVIARQVEREYSRAAQHVSRLVEGIARERQSLEATPDRRNRRDYSRRPGAERERAVTERIRTLLGERLRSDVPESVRQFLFEVWLRHLRTAALRNGEESSEFGVAMQVVDDLVWSLDARAAPSKVELAQRIPPLIRLMTQGLREIGAKNDEYRAFFDELFLIHLRRMQGRPEALQGGDEHGRSGVSASDEPDFMTSRAQ